MRGPRRLARRLWQRIVWRLLASYLVVGLTAIVLLGVFGLLFAGTAVDTHADAALSSFRRQMLHGLLLAGLSAVLAAAAVSLFVSRRILEPLRQIMAANRRIASGHYGERVPVRDDFELSRLAAGFNRMADALEQTEERRQALIADVAHELRTPLTSIKGYLEALIDGVLPGNETTYGQIHREADRLYRLVEDLQELSRLEAGQAPLDRRPLDAAALLASVAEKVRPQFQACEVRLAVRSEPDTGEVEGDDDRLCQVLLNLLSNALRHTPAGGGVDLQGFRERGWVYLSVRDTGSGIPSQHIEQIFTRFYRVDKSRSRPGGGTGIGLTIARHLVEMHGGTITVTSTVGLGSTFTVALPARVTPPAPGRRLPPAATRAP